MPRILIVDDDSAMRHLIKIAIRDIISEAALILVGNRADAERMLAGNIDIVITDINLTSSDPNGGLHIITEARKVKDDTIIIAMSSGDHRSTSIEAGANQFHSKRRGEETLARLVRALWQKTHEAN